MDVLLAVLQAATLVLILALVYRPLGDYMAHIYTSTKLPWLTLPAGVPAVAEYYSAKDYWPAESLKRRAALRGP